jgi:hypothetical protein
MDLPNNSYRLQENGNLVRRWQFSLRVIFAFTAATALFLSAGRVVGHVDATFGLLALLFLVRALRRPKPVTLTTGVFVTIIAGVLLWANLRPTVWQGRWDLEAPSQLDPITEKMFWRGWPISPWMLCPLRHMVLDPDGRFVGGALVVDAILYVIAVSATKVLSEESLGWLKRRRRRLSQNKDVTAR